jgi:hypothetical protein
MGDTALSDNRLSKDNLCADRLQGNGLDSHAVGLNHQKGGLEKLRQLCLHVAPDRMVGSTKPRCFSVAHPSSWMETWIIGDQVTSVMYSYRAAHMRGVVSSMSPQLTSRPGWESNRWIVWILRESRSPPFDWVVKAIMEGVRTLPVATISSNCWVTEKQLEDSLVLLLDSMVEWRLTIVLFPVDDG